MSKKLLIGIPLLLAAGLLLAFIFWDGHRSKSGQLKVTGNIEVTEVALSFKVAGRVASRLVDEGDPVAKGQLVARLDAADLEHEVALRQAEVAAARAQLADLEAGYRTEEVAQARAALEKAQAEASNATENFARDQHLFEGKVIPKRVYDAAATSLAVTRQAVNEAKEKLTLLRKGYRPEQIAKSRAQADQAEAALALARTRLGYATLASPVAGFVLTKNVEPGEYVNPGTPVVTVGELDEVWLRGFISETDLGRVRLGQKAYLTIDTYPGKRYQGRVSFIASEAEFTPKQVQTERERVKLMYRIKITVPNPSQELKPGMPADGVILLEGGDHGQPAGH
ncbi:MAG: efflux RND transporter periplasmic adaptor subunit [Desulfobacteraceae bacterium]|nr:efflux RND transporter periplasmic adaptor subunit [Desulfobacteraceae bacterium]